jgi:hypothetical protein
MDKRETLSLLFMNAAAMARFRRVEEIARVAADRGDLSMILAARDAEDAIMQEVCTFVNAGEA